MKHTVLHSMPRLTLLCVALSGCAATAAENTQAVSVENPRPVAAAIQQIEKMYNVPITYEDARYVNDSEMAINEQGHSVIKTRSVTFTPQTLPSDAALDIRKQSARSAVADVLRSYNVSRGAEMFTVTDDGEGLHVTPLRFVGKFGSMENASPLLETPISLSPSVRTAAQAVREIAQAISASTGRPVGAGTLPSLFARHTTTIAASNEPARVVLERLFQEMPLGYESKPNKAGGSHIVPGATLSWRLLCGYETSPECSLNIHVVAPEGRATVALEGQPAAVIRPEGQ